MLNGGDQEMEGQICDNEYRYKCLDMKHVKKTC